jgi:hypothetical protein
MSKKHVAIAVVAVLMLLLYDVKDRQLASSTKGEQEHDTDLCLLPGFSLLQNPVLSLDIVYGGRLMSHLWVLFRIVYVVIFRSSSLGASRTWLWNESEEDTTYGLLRP